MDEEPNGKSIMIVDDQLDNLNYLADYFIDKMGLIVERAEDGIKALKKLESFIPDLILLDNIMPNMTGHELVQVLKANPKYRSIPIIMFSANDNIGEKTGCLSLGIQDYIVKPINLHDLEKRIKEVMNKEA
jgi:CheY-like chemotaxis protein